jgi:hypothetical protein
LHPGGHDRRPSASIKIDQNGKSLYYCFTCKLGEKSTFCGVLNKLRRFDVRAGSALQFARKCEPTEVVKFFTDELATSFDKGEELFYREIDFNVKMKKDTEGWDEGELSTFIIDSDDKLKEVAGVLGLPVEQIYRWEIGFDIAGYITFPIRRSDGTLVGIVGRRPQGKSGYKNYLGMRKSYLYGEHRILSDVGYKLVVVEGMRDTLFVDLFLQRLKSGVDVCSTMGVTFTRSQVARLRALNRPLLLMGDGDEEGWRFNADLERELNRYVPVRVIDLPEGIDPKNLSEAELYNYIF